jgi:hypothetical protein
MADCGFSMCVLYGSIMLATGMRNVFHSYLNGRDAHTNTALADSSRRGGAIVNKTTLRNRVLTAILMLNCFFFLTRTQLYTA